MNADYSLTAYFVAARAYYVSSIYAYGKVGTGSVINPNNLIGRSSNDGNYATLYAGNYGDSAYMTANITHLPLDTSTFTVIQEQDTLAT